MFSRAQCLQPSFVSLRQRELDVGMHFLECLHQEQSTSRRNIHVANIKPHTPKRSMRVWRSHLVVCEGRQGAKCLDTRASDSFYRLSTFSPHFGCDVLFVYLVDNDSAFSFTHSSKKHLQRRPFDLLPVRAVCRDSI